MAIFVNEKADIKKLLQQLELYKPESLFVYNDLKENISRHRIQSIKKYYVDAWPDFSCVIGMPFTSIDPNIEDAVDDSMPVYSKDSKHLLDLLQSLIKVIPWNRKFFLISMQKQYIGVLKEFIAKHTGKNTEVGIMVVCQALNMKLEDITKYRLPQNLTATSICDSDIKHIAEEMDYSRYNIELLIEWMVENNPSVAVRNEIGELIAFELCYPDGALGMLNVKPKYRGLGIAKYMTIEMTRKKLKLGCDVYVHIKIDNEASINLHTGCGFTLVKDNNGFFLTTV